MITYYEKINTDLFPALKNLQSASPPLFFDIETTGLSWRSSHIYLIGLLYFDRDTWMFRQWFLDHPFQEKEMLLDFHTFLTEYRNSQPSVLPADVLESVADSADPPLVHYNGDTFDLPYMRHKCAFYGLPDPFSGYSSQDLCKTARKLKKVTGMTSVRQKDAEAYLQIPRDDRMSGKDLIEVYYSYLKSFSEEDMFLLKLHNHDDVLGLTGLTVFQQMQDFLNGCFTVDHVEEKTEDGKPQYVLTLELPAALPQVFMNSLQDAIAQTPALNGLMVLRPRVSADRTLTLVLLPLYTELKHFFPDYKNYYYLPLEDQAIHKDVAVYVDSDRRVKAKKDTCYQRKSGFFLPDPDGQETPAFKAACREKMNWFLPDPKWADDNDRVHKYLLSLFRQLR